MREVFRYSESKFLLEIIYKDHGGVEYALLLFFRHFDPLAPDSLVRSDGPSLMGGSEEWWMAGEHLSVVEVAPSVGDWVPGDGGVGTTVGYRVGRYTGQWPPCRIGYTRPHHTTVCRPHHHMFVTCMRIRVL